MSRSTRVFLSYARDDASDLVQKVRAYLEPAGTVPWVDVKDIPAGVEWREELEKAIRDSDALVLIMTPAAVASRYVRDECEIAQAYQKRVIPLAMGDVAPPDWLRSKQYIRFKQFDDAQALGKLTGDLKNVWESVETRLKDIRYNAVTDELSPLLDHLEMIPAVLPRPVVRPEALLVCAEFVERMSKASEKHPLVELIAEWRAGGFITDTWQSYPAYQKHKVAVTKILEEAFKGVSVPDVTIVPFVLVVMTADESKALASEVVFDAGTDGLRAHFETVRAKLQAAGVDDWAARYQARPEQWQPFDASAAGQSLESLVSEELNRKGSAPPGELRRARFIDIRTVNDSREQLAELRKTGCIVVIDVVSVCHPQLLMEYRRSLLDVFDTTFLLKMGPLDPVPVFGKEKQHVTTLPFVQKIDSFFFERHVIQVDSHCAVAGEEVAFKRFMREKVLDLFLKEGSGVRQRMRRGGA